MENKKGFSVLMVIVFLFLAVFFVIFLSIFGYGLNLVDNSLSSINFNFSNISFSESYNDTTQKGIISTINILDTLGVGLIFGMVIVMMIIGFNLRTNRRLLIILDIFILIISFIIQVYLVNGFNSLATNPQFLPIFQNNLDKSSTIIYNLPFITVIVGIIIIIITYGISRKNGGELNDIGY